MRSGIHVLIKGKKVFLFLEANLCNVNGLEPHSLPDTGMKERYNGKIPFQPLAIRLVFSFGDYE